MAVGESVLWRQVRLIEFDTLASTNLEALKRAQAGDPGDLWITAKIQTEGRGRRGRRWESARGNFHASFLKTIHCSLEDASQISLVAGIALHATVQSFVGNKEKRSKLLLKWPNDLLMGDCKLAGILIECFPRIPLTDHGSSPSDLSVIIGIGANLDSSPTFDDRLTTSLKAQSVSISPREFLICLATQVEHWLDIWHEGRNSAVIMREWEKRAIQPGVDIKVRLNDVLVIEGKVAGLSSQGALLVDCGGEIRTVGFGDVEVIKADGGTTRNGP